ncbi:synaptojanin [Ciona intestinalis]
MSTSRQLKVYQDKSRPDSLLLEHRTQQHLLLLQDNCVCALSTSDGNELKSSCTKIADTYGCLGVIILNKDAEALVLITGCRVVGKLLDCEIYRISDVSFISLRDASDVTSSLSDLKRLLCSGSFYFSTCGSDDQKNLNLTRTLQKQDNTEDKSYLWNRQLLSYFITRGVNTKSWCVEIICGGIDIRTVYVGAQQGRAAVISRLSCDRVGTRYNVRGVDDYGSVANFVESEQIISIGDHHSSFLQIRGSVPLYWEQPGLNVGSHKVKIPAEFSVSMQAYESHLQILHSLYTDCAFVNLLGSKEGEASLSRAYQNHHNASSYKDLWDFISFDYHVECRVGKFANISKLMDKLIPILDKHGVLNVNESGKTEQKGVLRVNCLDCLDRTNSLQSYVGLYMITKQLEELGYPDNNPIATKCNEALKVAWQQTGDLISRMYAGTGALEGKDRVGKLRDGARSVSRAIQNNFLDQGKQDAMDRLLQISIQDPDLAHLSRTLLHPYQFMYSSQNLLRDMYRRREEFSTKFPIRVTVGTWNVNGGKLFRSIAYKDKGLKDWLLDENPTEEKKYYQALYDYNTDEEGDLKFLEKDILLVSEELDGGEWLRGVKGDEEGIFPAAYAYPLTNPHLVSHDFPAQQDGDLELYTDEVVDVSEVNGDWMTGSLMREGEKKEGTFPANFVTKMDIDIPVDIFAIGFEEMVELNAGNIVSTSQANQQAWGQELQKTISTKQDYVLLGSEQLVGVCLFVFVRQPLSLHVRDLSICTAKTGMGGATGNKGAVGISLTLFNSSLCFVCSHFAAGQTQVQERNNDFAEISNRLVFSKGRSLLSHDFVFWCGDFNYRIDLGRDEVKQAIKEEKWEKLKEFDQLLVQKKMGNCFKGFNEGETNFAPTYKYDLFSDDYDTSEKCRVPAWTDRILWKRKNWLSDDQASVLVETNSPMPPSGKLLYYRREELKTSDHRPVVAAVDIELIQVDEIKSFPYSAKAFQQIEPVNQSVVVYVDGKSTDEQLCQDFISTFEVGNPVLTRCFQSCFLVVFPEAWMAAKSLEFDNTVFHGSLMKVAEINQNELIELNEDDNEISSISANQESTALSLTNHNTFPTSYSSDNLTLPTRPLTRPQSTPILKSSPTKEPLPPTRPQKKVPPPRPPAITKATPPPKPEAPNVVSAPLQNPPITQLPPSSFTTPLQPEILTPTEVVTPPSHPITKESLDLTFFFSPKIKPRKTVPKRRAPVAPGKPQPQPRQSSSTPATPIRGAPKPPTPILQNGSTKGNHNNGFLLDDPFSCDQTSQSVMPPPLIPFNQSRSVDQTPSIFGNSLFDPFSSTATNSNPLSTPDNQDPFSVFGNPPAPASDPWATSTSVVPPQQISSSFSTNFNDFDIKN